MLPFFANIMPEQEIVEALQRGGQLVPTSAPDWTEMLLIGLTAPKIARSGETKRSPNS
jgi:hypothetical protein